MSKQQLDTKYIVTGASSGIGLAITKMLLKRKSKIIGLSRNMESSELSQSENMECINVDFTDPTKTIEILEKLKANTDALSGIICCAGFGRFGALEQFSHQQIIEQLNVNLIAHIFLCKAFVPLLKQQKSGKIIFIGSNAALRGSEQGSIYCASKFGLRGFSQALRQECSRSQIGVSLINPGMLNTRFYETLNFKPGSAKENTIDTNTICDTIELIINSPPQVVFDEINISPLKHVVEKSQAK